MALLSRASCDIASKTVTGRSPKTLFREIMGTISRPNSSANLRPSRPASRPRDACRKEALQPAPPATRSLIVCRTGRQTPPVCPSGREWLADRSSPAAPRPRRDRHRPLLHWAHARRPEDSAPRPYRAIRLRPPNREPDALAPSPLPPLERLLLGRQIHHISKRKIKRPATQIAYCPGSNSDLRSHFDHATARNLKVVGRIVGGAAQRDEEMILPARHPGMRGGFERAAGQEKGRRHDVELPAELARNRQRFRHIRRLHEAEPQRNLGKGITHLLQSDAFRWIDARGWRGLDGENDVLLVQHFV